ncbi:cytochrome P450 [Exidia glandulosa HHB12029]|uniref:Cytochrome P450 n=1 Tax=Exidia glandulosa HHB12029 TaxID=1314781 RepID=A0A165LIA8_EXIGL|nr:cytochrome P450 [Exidia glandulosa HHB12029]
MFERETYIQQYLSKFHTLLAFAVALVGGVLSIRFTPLELFRLGGALASGLALAALTFYIYRRTRFYISPLPGPPSSSFLAGSELEYYHEEAAVTSLRWTQQYGPALKFKAALWGERLIISDPRALSHICNTNALNYDRPAFGRALVMRLVGPGIVWAVGDTHQRHRRVIMPMYNGKHLRSALPVFQHYAGAVKDKWRTLLADSDSNALTLNVHREVTAAALDVLFDFSYEQRMGTIENPDQRLAVAFRDLFISAFGQQTAYSIMVREILDRVPKPVLRWIEAVTPDRKVQSSRASFAVAQEQAVQMIEARRASRRLEADTGKRAAAKDLMDALLQTIDDDPRLANTVEGTAELVAQVATMAQAGQETTGSTTAFLLWELCNRPEWQDKLRDEIRERKQRLGSDEFDATDYEAMPVLQAIIRETLRYHPVCPKVDRAPYKDDVIPLQHPVSLPDGTTTSHIKIAAGTVIHVDIASYNRNKEFFGQDADEWNPARWLVVDKVSSEPRPGVVAGIFTFIDGPRSCLGWKFAMLEIAVIVTSLVDEFELQLEPGHRIIRGFGGVMGPLTDGEWSGWNLPCIIRTAY